LVTDVFGSNVFSLASMRERLTNEVYNQLLNTIQNGEKLDPAIGDVVANAIKDWAVEKGATHFCHWFQPLTGMTAEKHDSFISPLPDGRILLQFSAKDLTQGEPDASSFPSGSLRESFEARGYTVWDCTSPIFVKEDGANVSMFIPSAFCSYNGYALDYKTPLLRAKDAVNKQAMRVLKALGNTTSERVIPMMGAEQEYFLINRRFVEQRLDLMQTGRTLFGAPNPKGMASSVHYFGTVHENVASFMHDVNNELWKLGVSAKTQHNEISPCQYEIAPIFNSINVATDHNQLTMEALQKIAERHDMECLLHEKPFRTLGGSGKHINFSLSTDDGLNLLDPGDTPYENEVFLVFLAAFIKAVDTYPELLRSSVADAGNDQRLGAMEAPPPIISIFLGEALTKVLKRVGSDNDDNDELMEDPISLGVSTIPPLPKDVSDRNRTSPFAFTGNRFEFRTAGSAVTTSRPSFTLCTIVADVLAEIADELEQAKDVNTAAQDIIKKIVKEHKRIIFNGDNYCDEWLQEAQKRDLPILMDTVDAFSAIQTDKITKLFERQKVLNKDELDARTEITFQRYAECVTIEGRTALRLATRQILPAALSYTGRVADNLNSVKQAGGTLDVHQRVLKQVSSLTNELSENIDQLSKALETTERIADHKERATKARDLVIPAMAAVRKPADELEMIVDADLWPLPTYADMVFRG
jgi:glutamine synthetase